MARKTKKQIRDKLIGLSLLQYEKLIRNPTYCKDFIKYENKLAKLYKIYGKNDIKTYKKLAFEEESKLVLKYKIVKMLDPLKSFQSLVKNNYELFPFDLSQVSPAMLDMKYGLGEKMKNVKAAEEEDKIILCHVLEDNRYAKIIIDTDREKEIILLYVEWFIDWITRKKSKFKIGKIPKASPRHLDKIDRYFKVFDLRNQRPPLGYTLIASKLSKEGYFKNKTLEQATESVKKDYRVAFKEVYGVSYKRHDRDKALKLGLKGCSDCDKKGSCKELCSEIEYMLSKEEVKQKHYIGDKDISEQNI